MSAQWQELPAVRRAHFLERTLHAGEGLIGLIIVSVLLWSLSITAFTLVLAKWRTR
jgi:hypothetical protein